MDLISLSLSAAPTHTHTHIHLFTSLSHAVTNRHTLSWEGGNGGPCAWARTHAHTQTHYAYMALSEGAIQFIYVPSED